jgi:hypothetical protein
MCSFSLTFAQKENGEQAELFNLLQQRQQDK